jgi:hypothetical protein
VADLRRDHSVRPPTRRARLSETTVATTANKQQISVTIDPAILAAAKAAAAEEDRTLSNFVSRCVAEKLAEK